MTTPSLLKRLEAIEGVRNPRAPIVLWKPHSPSAEALPAFEARLAAAEAAHPSRQIMIFAWAEPT